jgi:large conductance mechanosensitive channel
MEANPFTSFFGVRNGYRELSWGPTACREEDTDMMRGFRDFLLRGNVVDLAIAVVIGVAFGAVVTAFVKDLITPLIAAIGGQPNFSALSLTVNKSHFLYGDFIDTLIAFVIIAAVIYYFVVVPYNRLMTRFRPMPEPAPTRDCPFCLSNIPAAANRCPFCTAELERQTGAPAPA